MKLQKNQLMMQNWFDNLPNRLTERENKIAQHILKEIKERLNFNKCWIKLFNSFRESGTLSGGEFKE